MKRDKDLPRRHGLRHAEDHVLDRTAPRLDAHVVSVLQFKTFGVTRVHLYPRFGRKPVEERDLSGFSSGVPMLDGPARIQPKRVILVRTLGGRVAFYAPQFRAAVLGLEDPVRVKP